MPISLTSAFDPGDVDPGHTYAKLQIIEFHWSETLLHFRYTYGAYVDNVFVRGAGAPIRDLFLSGADLTSFMTTNGSTYASVRDALYQYLLDHSLAAGTIDE